MENRIIKTGAIYEPVLFKSIYEVTAKTCTSDRHLKPARSKWSDYRRAVPHPEQTGYRIPHDI